MMEMEVEIRNRFPHIDHVISEYSVVSQSALAQVSKHRWKT